VWLIFRLTKAFVLISKHKTLFEQILMDMNIEYKHIHISTLRHNGKVERVHHTDRMRFYDNLQMYSLEDGRKQLAAYNRGQTALS